jgi:biotin carboxyl carrier protein
MKQPAPQPQAGIRYEARLGNRAHEVAVEVLGGDRYRVHIDGRTLDVDARRTEGGSLSLLLGTEAFEIDSEPVPGNGALRVDVRGERYEIEVLSERQRRQRRTGAAGHAVSEGSVTAPMPGKVVKLLAGPGDAVRAGQGIIVIEAMKMENELRAVRDGVVREVRVRVGQAVELRETLVVID